MKYRFLVEDEVGNIVPLFNKDQSATGIPGPLMLYFTGHPGSGTEFCDSVT